MTNKINDGGAAFPRPIGHNPQTGGKYNLEQAGMTYRQWLAGIILQGSMSRGISIKEVEQRMEAQVAIQYADALIAELEKEQS